jgi:hypothetical protein
VEGALRAQAFFLLQDPWANAYNPAWKEAARLPKGGRILGETSSNNRSSITSTTA